MVVQNVIMEEDDDLEALRLAALQTIRPRKPTRRNMAPVAVHRQLDKGPFFQSEVNPNLIAIVPSILPPPAIDSGKLTADSASKPSEKSTKTSNVTTKELNQNAEKTETVAEDVKKTEKIDPPNRVLDEVKKEAKNDKSEIFDLEEDVLDFETESLAGSEEDMLQLHDSDSDSLERLMEQIEEELSSPVKTTRLKPKPAASAPSKPEAKVEINKATSEIIIQNKVKNSPKPESPKPAISIAERLSPPRRRYSPAQNSNPPVASQSPPRRSRSPLNHKRSLSPRKRSLTPRKRSITPRKRSITPRKRSLTPRKRSLTPRKRSLSPRRRSITPLRRSLTPRKRSLTPRRRSITPRKRSMSPRRRSPWRFSPRRRSISPRHRRSVSPRRRSPVDRRRSPSLWRRSLSPRRPQSPRRRSPTPKKRSLSPRRRSLTPKKRSLSPRKRSLSPRRRSISPKQNSPLKRQRVRSPVPLKRGKRLSPVAGRRNWTRNKNTTQSNRPNNPSKSNFNSNNKNQKDEERRKRGEVNKDNKAKEKDMDLVDGKGDNDIKNGETKPLDPKLEARRRKFESNSIVEPLNKKIRLKSESLRGIGGGGNVTDGARADENQALLRVNKRKRIVLSNENKSSEKVSEVKLKPLLPKVTNSLKKTDEKKMEPEEVVVKKKRKEVVEDSTKEDSNKKGVDLRAELSRRRAERLKGASIDPMARIVQSAIEGAVGKIKNKSRTSPVSEPEAPVPEKKSKPKGRRVHVLPANSSKSEDKRNMAEDKSVGISMQYRAVSPARGSGRSILRRNQV